MSYASFVDRGGKNVFVFAKISRKRRFAGSDMVFDGSESKYYLPFTLGDVESVALTPTATAEPMGRVELTEESSLAALGSGEWFFDDTQDRLYFGAFIDSEGGALADDTLTTIVVEYWTFVSSADIGWFKTPTDDTTEQVRWAGCISEHPEITKSVSENFAGFTPVEITPLVVAWHNTDLFENAYSDSYADCSCDIWTALGSIDTTRIRKLFTGKIKGVQINDTEIRFSLIEDSALFEKSYVGRPYEDESTALDPNATGQMIPLIYGLTRWIKAINIDYISASPTTSDNRTWAVHDWAFGSAEATFTLTGATSLGGGIYTVTMSAADAAKMIHTQRAKRNSGGEWVTITKTAGVFEMNTGGAFTPANGQVFTRPAIQEYYFQVPSKQNAVVNWFPSSSSTVSSSVVGNCLCAVLTTGFEAAATALGLTTINPDDFEVWVKCIGPDVEQTLDSAYFEGDGPSEVGALLWYLKNVVGLDETKINIASFNTALTARPINASTEGNVANFITPFSGYEAEKHRDVIGRLLRQIGAVGYFNADGEFTIKCRDAFATADWELTDAEIEADSFEYELSQDDCRSFILSASTSYLGSAYTTTTAKPATTTTKIRFSDGQSGGPVSSDEGFSWMDAPAETVELYDVNKDVQSSGRYLGRYGLARIATYYGARRGIAKLKAFGEIIDAVPGETVSISREIMPGFSYVPGTLRTRQFFILEVRRTGDMVELLIEDQYSIEEAGGF